MDIDAINNTIKKAIAYKNKYKHKMSDRDCYVNYFDSVCRADEEYIYAARKIVVDGYKVRLEFLPTYYFYGIFKLPKSIVNRIYRLKSEDYYEREVTRKLEYLNRTFTSNQKNKIWNRADGMCQCCGDKLVPFSGEDNSFEADHIKPYSKGGLTTIRNGQALCRWCNRSKKDN